MLDRVSWHSLPLSPIPYPENERTFFAHESSEPLFFQRRCAESSRKNDVQAETNKRERERERGRNLVEKRWEKAHKPVSVRRSLAYKLNPCHYVVGYLSFELMAISASRINLNEFI